MKQRKLKWRENWGTLTIKERKHGERREQASPTSRALLNSALQTNFRNDWFDLEAGSLAPAHYRALQVNDNEKRNDITGDVALTSARSRTRTLQHQIIGEREAVAVVLADAYIRALQGKTV